MGNAESQPKQVQPDERLRPVFVEDKPQVFDKDAHLYPPEYDGHFESLLLDAPQIRKRVKAMAKLIHEDYKGTRPILLCTLKGASPFYTHLSDVSLLFIILFCCSCLKKSLPYMF
jgi:hypothetical protein